MNMPKENIVPGELAEVATSLEKQFEKFNIPSRKVEISEWNCLSSEFRKTIPEWLIALLANHSLVRPFLNLGKQFSDYNQSFSFWPPTVYSKSFSDSIMNEEIVNAGFILLSDTSDGTGNSWLINAATGPLSPLYLFDLSDWERRPLGMNLVRLLASSAVDHKNWRNH